MKRTPLYRSEALAAIHETMAELHASGAINKVTMREFDEVCLQPVPTRSGQESAKFESDYPAEIETKVSDV